MEFYFKNFQEYKESGFKAYREKDFEKAREHLLKASKFLFLIAQESKGNLKEERKQIAKKLRKKALSIKIESNKNNVEEKNEPEKKINELATKEISPISFNDIAGLCNVKESIKLRMVYPFIYPSFAEKYFIKKGGGILLYGPPGTGKTMIAKAVASEITATFFSVKPSDIMDKLVGESEKKIENLFLEARKHEKSIIFFDEVEALLSSRREDSSPIMQRIVPQILQELEGVKSKNDNLLFIGATNTPWNLDPAILRPGRFDQSFFIPLPDLEARKIIFQLNLKDKPLEENINFEKLSNLTKGFSGADIKEICNETTRTVFLNAVKENKILPISMEALENIINSKKPSVSKEYLLKYENFCNK